MSTQIHVEYWLIAPLTGAVVVGLLGAELDHDNARAVFSVLAASKVQVLATMVSLDDERRWEGFGPITVFHVEQGVIKETNSMA